MISPLAYVSPKAQLGKNVTVDAFAYIDDNVILGDNCHVFPNAVIGCIPQDLKFKGEETWTVIGDNCVLREFVTIHRGTASKGKTVVGNNNLIMAYCHVAHDCILHDNIIMSNCTQLAGEVEVDDFAIVGGGTLVHQFSHIGSHVMIQGGSKINKDIPPYITDCVLRHQLDRPEPPRLHTGADSYHPRGVSPHLSRRNEYYPGTRSYSGEPAAECRTRHDRVLYS